MTLAALSCISTYHMVRKMQITTKSMTFMTSFLISSRKLVTKVVGKGCTTVAWCWNRFTFQKIWYFYKMSIITIPWTEYFTQFVAMVGSEYGPSKKRKLWNQAIKITYLGRAGHSSPVTYCLLSISAKNIFVSISLWWNLWTQGNLWNHGNNIAFWYSTSRSIDNANSSNTSTWKQHKKSYPLKFVTVVMSSRKKVTF